MQYDVRFLKKYFIYIGTCYESFRDHDQCKAFETLKSLFKNNMRLIRLKFILITYTNLDVILTNKLFYDMFFFLLNECFRPLQSAERNKGLYTRCHSRSPVLVIYRIRKKLATS